MLKISIVLMILIFVTGCTQTALPGIHGNPGAVGPTGAQGVNSLPCIVAPIPAGAEVVCPDGSHQDILNGVTGPTGSIGTSGYNGATGVTGAPGSNGVNGQTGSTGAQGIGVYAVQLCTQYSGHYSSSFPEYALCINDVLFGVYWDGHNSWLAQMYPGEYKSTATSAPCNFTVGTQCEVHR